MPQAGVRPAEGDLTAWRKLWSFTLDPYRTVRRPTRVVRVGDVGIGGSNPIRIQSMTIADTLDTAIGRFLEEDRSPARKVGQIDNRGSHFYLALYWAEALAAQTADRDLQARFARVARQLRENEATIVAELNAAQGRPVDIGGYYRPDPTLASKAMRPSATFNAIVDAIAG